MCLWCIVCYTWISWWYKTISSVFKFSRRNVEGVLMPLFHYVFSYQISNRAQIDKWKTWNVFCTPFLCFSIMFHAYLKHSQAEHCNPICNCCSSKEICMLFVHCSHKYSLVLRVRVIGAKAGNTRWNKSSERDAKTQTCRF